MCGSKQPHYNILAFLLSPNSINRTYLASQWLHGGVEHVEQKVEEKPEKDGQGITEVVILLE